MPYPRLLPPLATGALLFACYFPLNCGWLAWVALVPLLCLVRSPAPARRVFFCAWAGGLLFFVSVLQWMRHADPMMVGPWLLLAVYCALFVPAGVLLVRRLDRTTRLPLVVTLPAVWVALEFFRAHFLTGFSWYLLGHTQHDFLPVIQVADLGGVYAVSVLVAAVNALLFELLYARPWFRALFRLDPPGQARRLALQGVAVAVLLLAALGYGAWRLSQNDFEKGPKVALVQSNLSMRVKNEEYKGEQGGATGVMRRDQIRLTDLAVARGPELVVWPETSWPGQWVEVPEAPADRPKRGFDSPEGGDLLDRIARQWRTDVLLGLNTSVYAPDGPEFRLSERLNSALLVTGAGAAGERYDKIHRVPFGEYVPLRDWLPFMEWFSPYDFDYSIRPGERLTRFPLGKYHYGVLICYEDTVSDLARQYAVPGANGPAADFLVNTSNDGWFDGSAEHEQHLAVCRFRAVEARCAVARSVNLGISAVVDPNGRVLAPETVDQSGDAAVWEVPDGAGGLPVGRWGEFKKVSGVLVASIPIDSRASAYARFGDWLAWACWLLLATGLALSFRRRQAAAAAAN